MQQACRSAHRDARLLLRPMHSCRRTLLRLANSVFSFSEATAAAAASAIVATAGSTRARGRGASVGAWGRLAAGKSSALQRCAERAATGCGGALWLHGGPLPALISSADNQVAAQHAVSSDRLSGRWR